MRPLEYATDMLGGFLGLWFPVVVICLDSKKGIPTIMGPAVGFMWGGRVLEALGL